RSLYQRAVGYSYDAVKIFCDKNGNVTKLPYQEHVPPDLAACIFWLKNRDPARWRDAWQLEHTLGKYIISDKPMSEEQWTKERATLIEVTPDKGAEKYLLRLTRWCRPINPSKWRVACPELPRRGLAASCYPMRW